MKPGKSIYTGLLSLSLLAVGGVPHDARAAADGLGVEILIGDDNGHGSGMLFDAAEGDNLLTVPLDGVGEGVHAVHFRVKDSDGNLSTTVTRVLYVTDGAQVIAAEYFVDDDPGAGHGTPITVGGSAGMTFAVPTARLSTGLHSLTVRFRDDAGNWAGTLSRQFLVTRNSLTIEWFYDADPGVGNGNTVEAGDDDGICFIPTDGLDAGVHTLSVRCRDRAGNWSTTVTRALYVVERGDIAAVEYFVDSDPGEGNATAVTLLSDGSATFAVPTEALAVGVHTLTVRTLDGSGSWVPVFETPFSVTPGTGGVGGVEWLMSFTAVRDGDNVIVSGENVAQGCRVEIYTPAGQLLYSGEWTDSSAPLTIAVDPINRNIIVRLISPDGLRAVRRVR